MKSAHLVRAAPGERVGNDVRGQNGTREEEAAELFGDDPEVAHTLPGYAAPLEFLGNQHGRPAEFGALLPDVTIEAERTVHHLAENGSRPCCGEKPARRLTQQLLVG